MVAVVDLFAGAGGFGVGGQLAGCDLRLSVEIEQTPCLTLKRNAAEGHAVLQADLTEIKGKELLKAAGLRKADELIVVGGAPCQPFSKASNWVDEGLDHQWRKQRARGEASLRPPPPKVRPDDRRTLVDEFSRLVIETDADGFVFENVAALLSKRNKPVLEKMRKELCDAGFKTLVVKHFASEFGVAQHRERVFVLGSRRGVLEAPRPTHWAKTPVDGLLAPTPVKEVCKPFAAAKFFEPEEQVKPSATYFRHLNEIDPGWNYKQLTDWAGYLERPGRAFEVSPFVAERRYWNFLLVLDPDKPSWTIPAVYGSWNGPFHWKQSDKRPRRRLRTSEIAAIQDFPATYEIAGSWRERVRQLGNAVPPTMAAAMITPVAASLRN